MKRKYWLILLGVVVIAGAGYFAYRQFDPATAAAEETEPEIQTAVARLGELVIYASGAGEVVPVSELALSFDLSGVISEVLVRSGEQVSAGQVLARLDKDQTPEETAIEIAQAKLAVVEARQALEDLNLNAAVAAAQALQELEAAQTALDELLNPALEQALAYKTYLEAQLAVDEAESTFYTSQLTASQANIDAAYADLIIKQESLEKAEERYADYADRPDGNLGKAQAQASLSAAQSAYESAQRNYNAMISAGSELDQAIAKATFDLAQAQLAQAELEWEAIRDGSAETDLALAQAKLAAAQAAYERVKDGSAAEEITIAEVKITLAETDLAALQAAPGTAELRAPVDGTVTAISYTAGASVTANNPVITLADIRQAYLRVYLDETDIENAAVGYAVEVVFDAFPDEIFTGQVIEVDPSITRVSNSPAVSLLAALDPASFSKPRTLAIGLNATVDVIGGRAENAVLVPVEAVREIGPGEYTVFVMENDEPRLRVVTVGLMDFTYAEITSGLEAGEVVSTGIVATE